MSCHTSAQSIALCGKNPSDDRGRQTDHERIAKPPCHTSTQCRTSLYFLAPSGPERFVTPLAAARLRTGSISSSFAG